MSDDRGAVLSLDATEITKVLVSPEGLWRDVRVVAETGSTNAGPPAAARAGAAERTVPAAHAQTAARGRMGPLVGAGGGGGGAGGRGGEGAGARGAAGGAVGVVPGRGRPGRPRGGGRGGVGGGVGPPVRHAGPGGGRDPARWPGDQRDR